jgi:glycogen debranching enzyme
MELEQKLRDNYLAILKSNQRTTKGFRYTVPSSSVYPYQWLWDSCFHAIIYTHFDIKYAQDEIRALLDGQWENGMLPHMIYWTKVKKHNVDWGVKGNTSSITQPPMLAYAVETIFKKDKDINFIKEVLDRLNGYYQWLERERSFSYLLSIVHPWESGEDNFVAWDEIYGLNNPSRKELWKIKLELVKEYNKLNHNTKKFLKTNKFNLKCLLFNAVYLRNLNSMLFLCQLVNSKHLQYYKEIIPKVKKSFKEKLYNREKGLYSSVYNNNKHLSQIENSSIFLPLFAKILTRNQAKKLIEEYLLNENKFWLKYPLPTIAVDNLNFQPNRSWRGSTWININWFIVKGLDNYGYKNISDKLKKKSIELIEKSGFCEYFNPVIGKGHGPKDFTWSGLIFDM